MIVLAQVGQSSVVNDTRLTNTQPTSRRLSFSNSRLLLTEAWMASKDLSLPLMTSASGILRLAAISEFSSNWTAVSLSRKSVPWHKTKSYSFSRALYF